MTLPATCPSCSADFDGGEIPEAVRKHYSPPYRWSRVIAIVDPRRDRTVSWRCPDCDHSWLVKDQLKEAHDAPAEQDASDA